MTEIDPQATEHLLHAWAVAVADVGDVVFVTDAEGTIRYVNPAFSRVYGYSALEAIGKTPSLLRSGLLGQEFYQDLWRTISGGHIYRSEHINRTKAGQLVVVASTLTPILEHGKVRGFVAVQRNVTTEQRLREQLADLGGRLSRTFEHAISAQFVATADGRILACNGAFRNLFGIESPREALQLTLRQLFASGAAYNGFCAQLLQNRDLGAYELELVRLDGSPLLVVANFAGRFGGGGALLGLEGSMIAATRTPEATTPARVGHDINGYLTVILGYIKLAEESLADEHARAAMAGIRRASQRVSELARELMPAASEAQRVAAIDVRALLEELDGPLRVLLGEGIDLELTLGAQPAAVAIRPHQFEEIVLNLAANARDAMGEHGRLRVALDRVNGHDGHPQALLEIRDDGSGMTPHVRAHAFEPYFSTKGAHGTGLGLATVYGLVHRAGGRVDLDSGLGRGTIVRIALPTVSTEVS